MSSGDPTISIVIPTYNRRAAVLRLLASIDEALVAQAAGQVEVVVVVDGSSDGTIEALQNLEMSTPLRWRAQPNGGSASARNTGVAMAEGEVLWLLDDDMTIDAVAYEAHVAFHRANHDQVCMAPQLEKDASGVLVDRVRERVTRLSATGEVTDPYEFWTGNVSIGREQLLRVGGFCEAFRGWGLEDVELGFRLRKAGIRIAFVPSAAAQHWRLRPRGEMRLRYQAGRNLAVLRNEHPDAPVAALHMPPVVRVAYDRGLQAPAFYVGLAAVADTILRIPGVANRVGHRVMRTGRAAAYTAGVLESGGPDLLHEVAAHGTGASVAPVPDFDSPRSEYERTGMIHRTAALDHPEVINRVLEDAPTFASAVARLRAEGTKTVPYAFTPAIVALANDPAITRLVAAVLGDTAWVAWGANISNGTPNHAHMWHTDIESRHWPTITVAVGLSGCTEANATRYIGGSHRLTRAPGLGVRHTDDDLVLGRIGEIRPACRTIQRFSGFGDGRFYAFNAAGWHCGDPEASRSRSMLFLHYQRAAMPRIPLMADHTKNLWHQRPAPYIAGPGAEDHNRATYATPTTRVSAGRRARRVARKTVHRAVPRARRL